MSLLALIRLEFAIAADTRHYEAAIHLLSDKTSGNELLEQVNCCVSLRFLGLQIIDLGLEGIVLHDLGLGPLLFSHLSIKFVLDLLFDPLPLATFLEQIG